MRTFTLSVLVLAGASACIAPPAPPKRSVALISSPSGARFTTSTGMSGHCPSVVEMAEDEVISVTLEKDGYATREVDLCASSGKPRLSTLLMADFVRLLDDKQRIDVDGDSVELKMLHASMPALTPPVAQGVRTTEPGGSGEPRILKTSTSAPPGTDTDNN